MSRRAKTQRQVELDKKIGKRLKLVRSQMKKENGRKVTQSDFAEHYGVSDQAVRDWEAGRSSVPEIVLENLSDSLGIDIDFLKCRYDLPNLSELLEKWDKQRPNMKYEVEHYYYERQLLETAEKLGYIKIDSDDPERESSDFINYIKQYNEREVSKMTKSDVNVITNATTNEIRENFETGEITIYAVTDADVEKGFQQLIKRGIIEE